MAKRNRKSQTAKRPSSLLDQLGWWIVAVFAFAMPLFVSPTGKDSFRLPKDVLFRAEGILFIGLFLLAMTWSRFSWREIPRRSPVIIVPVAAVVWTCLATAVSTNRTLSVLSLRTVVFAAAIFIGTTIILRSKDERAFLPLLLAAAINGFVYLLQEFGIWSPFGMTSAFLGHNSSSGFLGNANDVGSALLGPVLAAIAAALATSRRRLLNSAIGALLLVTLMVSRSLTAIGAVIAGLLTMALMRFGRRAALPLFLVMGVTVGLIFAIPPLRARLVSLQQMIGRHDYDEVLSGRTSAFRAATAMFLDHPVTGTGPGTFGWHYMPYKLRIDEESPAVGETSVAARYNFEEAHNDHLEVLAETGLPGYVILLSALVMLGSISLRRRDEEPTGRGESRTFISRLLALPLAVGFFVLALAQYPLQLASATAILLFLTAACFAWRGSETL
ncbi:MAG TPA: O-antigen ligase family protein [Thermoanaerobaculia bacterium]|nr:O-antigen ligase family protein [Thermoanaerobaculia bacterium]